MTICRELAAWTTADYALVVSIFSFAIAFCALVWNVWSKFIFPKPKLRVTFAATGRIRDLTLHDDIHIGCVNFGPTEAVIVGLIALESRIWRISRFRTYWGIPKDERNITGGRPNIDGAPWPRKLGAGEELSVKMSAKSMRKILEKDPTALGFKDSLDRFHQVPKKQLARIKEVLLSIKM